MPQERRSEHDQQPGRGQHAANREEMAPGRITIERPRGFERAAALDGERDQPVDQRRRMIGRRRRGRFDGAEDFRFERRIALFEVQRHLAVAHAPRQRHRDKPRDQRGDDEHDDDAEGDDGGGGESQRFEARRRKQEGQDRAADNNGRAAQRELQAPAAANLADNLDELRAIAWIAHGCLAEPRLHLSRRVPVPLSRGLARQTVR